MMDAINNASFRAELEINNIPQRVSDGMIANSIEIKLGQYLKLTCSDDRIASEQDVLDLVGVCGEHLTHQILIPFECFHTDFFDLRTGLAGILFQKFATYRIKTALVGDLTAIRNARFKELIFECNRGDQVHFFARPSDAEAWLTS